LVEVTSVSQLPEIVIALGVAVAAVWLPGALIIQATGLLRRRLNRARRRSVYNVGPAMDL
jgi:hypothetical protein